MFSVALWVLDQEYKAIMWIAKVGGFEYIDPDPSRVSDEEAFGMLLVGLTATVQTAAIGSMGYAQIFKAHDKSVRYLTQAKYDAFVPKGFSIGKKAPFIKPIWRTVGMKGSARFLAAKVGSRFIPYVGVALLMWDAWNVGKWIGHKTNPFD